MAIYHLDMKAISRSKGHRMCEALAYESGTKLEGFGLAGADFRKKAQGVESTQIIGTPMNLQEISDTIEETENRKNSTLGRRFVLALPHEIEAEKRAKVAQDFGSFLHKEYGTAVVVSIHKPEGDERNHHAHITMSDREVNPDGRSFGAKVKRLTQWNRGKDGTEETAKDNLLKIRKEWAELVNGALENEGSEERVSHLSYEKQGIEKTPTRHLGRKITEMKKKPEKGYFLKDDNFNKKATATNEAQRSNPKAGLTEAEQFQADVKELGFSAAARKRKAEKAKSPPLLKEEAKPKPAHDNNRDSEPRSIRPTKEDKTNDRGNEVPPGGVSENGESQVRSTGELGSSGARLDSGARESQTGGSKLIRLLREVNGRAGKLSQRKDESERERRARSYPNTRGAVDSILASRIPSDRTQNLKYKVLAVFKKIVPKHIAQKLYTSQLKELFKDRKKVFNEIHEKAVKENDRGR